MIINRLLNKSGFVWVCAALLCATPAVAMAQEPPESVQKLLERGAYDEAAQRAEAERGNPESTFFSAQALVRLNANDRARAEYARLREPGGADWQAIAESGEAMVSGDLPGARAAADRATAANGENAFAHYQKGLVALRQSQFRDAADAFSRATELRPDFAYAHYYAGIAHQRLKEIPRMAEHFGHFLKLAPNAPEAGSVTGILRSLRG